MTYLTANWPAPSNISTLTTFRISGNSQGSYSSNNLALHVGDDLTRVQQNRQTLHELLQLPGEPAWLEQTHSNRCVIVERDVNRHADAAITCHKRIPLAIMTADCLPIMLCNQAGTEIAAIHAGWRGLMHGIIANTVTTMQSSPDSLMAWIGPAICHVCYEVGPEVRAAFIEHFPQVSIAFTPKGSQYLANLAKIAELLLNNAGIPAVYHSEACTYERPDAFYSYRRSAETGRMATLIWFTS